MRHWSYIIGVCILLSPNAVQAQAADAPSSDSVRLSAQLDAPGAVQVGDSFLLRVTVSWNPAEVDEPIVRAKADEAVFDVSERTPENARRDKERGAEFSIKTFRYDITAFEPGAHPLPSFEAGYKLREGGERRTATAKAGTIAIADIPPDDALAPDIRDIQPVLAAPADIRTYVLIAAAILIPLAILALALIVWLRRRRKRLPAAPLKPARPIDEVAYELLDELAASDLLRRQKYKKYFGRLSWIVRGYLELRFDFPALEMTSYEIEEVMGACCDTACRRLVTDFNECCDLAKFAQWIPPDETVEEAMSMARDIIEQTTIASRLAALKETDNDGEAEPAAVAAGASESETA